MTGQEAVSVAKGFNDRLDISGVMLTKMDGDARGGLEQNVRDQKIGSIYEGTNGIQALDLVGMVKTIIEELGSIHILVNNAGITQDNLFMQPVWIAKALV